jgi:hypothetical protein
MGVDSCQGNRRQERPSVGRHKKMLEMRKKKKKRKNKFAVAPDWEQVR